MSITSSLSLTHSRLHGGEGLALFLVEVHGVFQSYWMCDMKDVPLSADSTGLGTGMNVAFNVVQCMDRY